MSASSAGPFTATAFGSPPNPEFEQKQERKRALIERGADQGHVLVMLDSDEWYPVYTPEPLETADKYGLQWQSVVQVSEADLARWNEVVTAFKALQDELRDLSEKS